MVHFKTRETYRSSKASTPNPSLNQPDIHWVPGELSSGVKRWGRAAEHSPLYTTKVKNEWSHNSTPPLAFMAFTRDINFNNTLLNKKVTPWRAYAGLELRRSTAPTLSQSRHYKGTGGKQNDSASLSREKTGQPLHRRLIGPRGRSRRWGKSRPKWIWSPNRPAASGYNAYSIPAARLTINLTRS